MTVNVVASCACLCLETSQLWGSTVCVLALVRACVRACMCAVTAMLAAAMLSTVPSFLMPLSHRDPRASPMPSMGALQCPPKLEHTHDVHVCVCTCVRVSESFMRLQALC